MTRMVWLAAIAAVLIAQGSNGVGLGPLCMGAIHARAQEASQERHTPEGEWCQRSVPRMSNKAHACACHQHNCLDPDPNHVSAHVDAKCLNYCTVTSCKCERMDCP